MIDRPLKGPGSRGQHGRTQMGVAGAVVERGAGLRGGRERGSPRTSQASAGSESLLKNLPGWRRKWDRSSVGGVLVCRGDMRKGLRYEDW